MALDRFGGTVHLLDLAAEDAGRFGARGSEAVLDRLPMLASTSLGPGRNKIYIRGVADSSFNGPSQSIVGQYLGDVRLTFNAPDPDLQLYDIAPRRAARRAAGHALRHRLAGRHPAPRSQRARSRRTRPARSPRAC